VVLSERAHLTGENPALQQLPWCSSLIGIKRYHNVIDAGDQSDRQFNSVQAEIAGGLKALAMAKCSIGSRGRVPHDKGRVQSAPTLERILLQFEKTTAEAWRFAEKLRSNPARKSGADLILRMPLHAQMPRAGAR
jgi:hypothetical protein